jgi:ABC-type amino acid transport substrate-binding protein
VSVGLKTALAATAFLLMTWNSAARAEGALRVCLNEDIPIYSVHRGKDDSGFDLAVAKALAGRLGRTLTVQWFESKLDEGTSTALEANALLSDGLCELVGGYPLIKDSLGTPGAETSKLPGHEGGKPSDRRRRVTLGTLVATRAYHYAPLTVVLSAKAASKKITQLADLDGIKLGVEGGTLADAILMTFGNGRLVDQITHLVPGRNELLPQLEKGEFDATLIELRRFDAYRVEHPNTTLRVTGYYHRIGFNMGFVGLSTEADLIQQVDAAIGNMLQKGEFRALAEAAGMTYLPPRQPEILESVTLVDLYRE